MTAQHSSWGTCGFLLGFRQMATLLGFHTSRLRLADLLLRWGFSVGLGVSCSRYPVTPLWFSTLCQRSSPSAASPSGFCALAGCVSMSDSSLLVYSWDCAGRVCAVPLGFSSMCRALPQGLQRALLSLMQVHWGFSGHRVSVFLLPW